jgi:hypothetical protein
VCVALSMSATVPHKSDSRVSSARRACPWCGPRAPWPSSWTSTTAQRERAASEPPTPPPPHCLSHACKTNCVRTVVMTVDLRGSHTWVMRSVNTADSSLFLAISAACAREDIVRHHECVSDARRASACVTSTPFFAQRAKKIKMHAKAHCTTAAASDGVSPWRLRSQPRRT